MLRSDQSEDDFRPGPIDALTDDVIRRLLGGAERLSLGVPRGFVRVDREQLLAREGITVQRALLIDEWVIRVGGGVRSLKPPTSKGLRLGRRGERAQRQAVVWEIPREAL